MKRIHPILTNNSIFKAAERCQISQFSLRHISQTTPAFPVAHTLANMDECCICLIDLSHTSNPVLAPCGHIFHENCIRELVEAHRVRRCPLCRRMLPGSVAQFERVQPEDLGRRETNESDSGWVVIVESLREEVERLSVSDAEQGRTYEHLCVSDVMQFFAESYHWRLARCFTG